MSVSRSEAGAGLAAIDEVVKRVKQSRIYRVSGEIVILWGAVDVLRYLVSSLSPVEARGWVWLIPDALGLVLTAVRLSRLPRARGVAIGRLLAGVGLFYAFGFGWSVGLGHFDGRQLTVFWHTLFLFGYGLAGLWFGHGFLVLGLGVSAAIFAVYLYAGAAFYPAVAVVSGLGFALCGLWMLRR